MVCGRCTVIHHFPSCCCFFRRRRIIRRSALEVGVAFFCHLILLCFYMYAHIYDGTVFKRNKGKGFTGWNTFGGRWKFLSYIDFVRGNLVYSPLHPIVTPFSLYSGCSLAISFWHSSRTLCLARRLSSGARSSVTMPSLLLSSPWLW